MSSSPSEVDLANFSVLAEECDRAGNVAAADGAKGNEKAVNGEIDQKIAVNYKSASSEALSVFVLCGSRYHQCVR